MITWEQDLIGKVQEGDPEAFAHLVKKYQDPIFNSICRILGDADAAADITQQAFVSAYEKIHTYNPEHRFFSWLYRIAYNGAMNRIKRRRYLQPLADIDLQDTGPSPADRLATRELNHLVNAGLATLAYKYRVLLVLRHYLNFSYAEIARITDLPVSSVRSRLYTARGLLRDQLLDQGVGVVT
jgi:RNA polymerase sigma-70 factor (ECF subfamily)